MIAPGNILSKSVATLPLERFKLIKINNPKTVKPITIEYRIGNKIIETNPVILDASFGDRVEIFFAYHNWVQGRPSLQTLL